jgi:hypothetical protein
LEEDDVVAGLSLVPDSLPAPDSLFVEESLLAEESEEPDEGASLPVEAVLAPPFLSSPPDFLA